MPASGGDDDGDGDEDGDGEDETVGGATAAAPGSKAANAGAGDGAGDAAKKKRKRTKKKKDVGWTQPKENPWVYVQGFPPDITEDEIAEHFRKCGILKSDFVTKKPKIKLYRGDDGLCKV